MKNRDQLHLALIQLVLPFDFGGVLALHITLKVHTTTKTITKLINTFTMMFLIAPLAFALIVTLTILVTTIHDLFTD